MTGANNTRVNGQTASSKVFGQNLGSSIIDTVANNNAVIGIIKDNVDKK